MLTKTKIALAAVLFAGTASIASAQEFDPNLANRYPTSNGAIAAAPSFQSSQVRLGNGANQGFVTGTHGQAQSFPYDSAPIISGGGY
jgi:hypothetical protein